MQTESLFKLVAATFAELGAGCAPISRTFLHFEGYFVGHCFRCADLHAVCERDGNAVEFFSGKGALLRRISLSDQEKLHAA